jgi:hypothetical protein
MIKYYIFFTSIGLLCFSLYSYYIPDEQLVLDQLYCRIKELELHMENLNSRIDCLEQQENDAKMHDQIYINKLVSDDYYV